MKMQDVDGFHVLGSGGTFLLGCSLKNMVKNNYFEYIVDLAGEPITPGLTLNIRKHVLYVAGICTIIVIDKSSRTKRRKAPHSSAETRDGPVHLLPVQEVQSLSDVLFLPNMFNL